MSKMLRAASLALMLGALAVPALAAPAGAAPAGDPVVARVNNEPILRSDIARELQSMGARASELPPQMIYPQLLEKAIVTKLVASKGYAEKLQNDKEVKDRLKDAEAAIVADVYVRKAVQPKITEDKIKARYDELAAKFKPEDEVRARHILVKTEDEANDILKQLKDGADFAKLATEKSLDKGSAKQGGDLGYFTRAVMVKPFAEAAFAMKAGDLSDKPIKTDFGYHIIKLEDRRKSSPPPLAEVKDQIMNQVGQDMVEQLVKDLKAKAKIERFDPNGNPLKEPEAKK